MEINNVEWKARCANLQECEAKLQSLNPEFCGEDIQTDTYFEVPQGRLKLREGNVENALIFYMREDEAGARTSAGKLYPGPGAGLKEVLSQALGEKVVVHKKRRIYFVDNVKIHFDEVPGLGHFVEVEALNRDGRFSHRELQDQCDFYQEFFGMDSLDMEQQSYSDLLLKKQNTIDLNTNTL